MISVLLLAALFLWHSPLSAFGDKESVVLSADSLYLSPNKDGIQDSVVFNVKTRKIKKIASWKLKIQDPAGTAQKNISGGEDMPMEVSWDGRDDAGRLQPEGAYEASFTVWDRKGGAFDSPPLAVVLDLSPPAISLTEQADDAPATAGQPREFRLNFSAVDLSGLAGWTIKIKDEKSKTVRTEISTGSLPAAWSFPANDIPADAGRLYALLSVRDRAGNLGVSPVLALGGQKPAPKEKTPGPAPAAPARLLQMTSIISLADVFGENASSDAPLLPQAEVLLGPIADALTRYKGAAANVLGHVDPQTSEKDEKALSSYFAWRIYSYLVRQKGADKNAVSVKGMGADIPIADNRTPRGRSLNRRIEIQLFLPAAP